ncbi:hypothetical protein OIO90_002369 [Microbotryomycetes sp. JL221]|nr:hypothetical protein OIO90_002369 [Microbotryomycetes sp. JL221]
MYTQEPMLALPSAGHALPAASVWPEKWIWRYPATTAIHAILKKIASQPENARVQQELVPIALLLARHALTWDLLIWAAALFNRNQHDAVELQQVSTTAVRMAGVHGLDEEPVINLSRSFGGLRIPRGKNGQLRRRRLRTQARLNRGSASSPPDLDEIHRLHAFKRGLTCPEQPVPLEPNLRPLLSLPVETIEQLFWALLRTQDTVGRESMALSLCLEICLLGKTLSFEAQQAAFKIAMRHKRPDLAARIVDGMHRTPVLRSSSQNRMYTRMLVDLCNKLPQRGDRGASIQKLNTLAAWATLVNIVEREWRNLKIGLQAQADRQAQFSVMLLAISRFPVAHDPESIDGDEQLQRAVEDTYRVALAAQDLMKRIVIDLVRLATTKALPLSIQPADYNVIMRYASLQMKAAAVVPKIMDYMRERGIETSSATYAALPEAEREGIVLDTPNMDSEHQIRTAITLLNYHVRRKDNLKVKQLAFQILPELDLHAQKQDGNNTSAAPYIATDNLVFRRPSLYLTVLSAVIKSGAIGLAERIFRLLRYAAQQSRAQATNDGKTRGWTVPSRAFVMMLDMYADEVVRGRRYEQPMLSREDRAVLHGDRLLHERAFVKGWGRNAIRVHKLEQERSRFEAQLGTGAASTEQARQEIKSDRFTVDHIDERHLPVMLRSEAAPIVAVWELEQGSDGPDLESLQFAMKSPEAKKALRILFGMELTSTSLSEALRYGKAKVDVKKEMKRMRRR